MLPPVTAGDMQAAALTQARKTTTRDMSKAAGHIGSVEPFVTDACRKRAAKVLEEGGEMLVKMKGGN